MRKITHATPSLRLPVLLTAMITLGAVSAYAQIPTAEEMQALQAQAQAQSYSQGQTQAQVGNYPPISTNDSTGGMPVAAGEIIGYDPQTGAPIYQPQGPSQTEVKKRQVLYEDMEQEITGSNDVPPDLQSMKELDRENTILDGEATGLPLDIRRDAIREAAISYGARGGLAWRTFAIRRELETRAMSMDKVYDFRQLLIPAPSGLMIEPPIINEALNSLLIEGDGQQAAVSDRFYNIVNNAKIVSAARTWRTYLEREWGAVEPPPDILRPENAEERKIWIELVEKGWEEGVRQADEIFQEDLNVLQADFQGMVRYRMLLSQGMVSPPYALQVDRGVTGDGKEMRIGDRAVQITGVPELITGSEQWQPANR